MSENCALIDSRLALTEAEILVSLNSANSATQDGLLRAAASVAEARREMAFVGKQQSSPRAIADSIAISDKSHLLGQVVTPRSSQALLRNFDNILGAGMHCPRCLLRGKAVRWFPEHRDEWQIFECTHCQYRVMDR